MPTILNYLFSNTATDEENQSQISRDEFFAGDEFFEQAKQITLPNNFFDDKKETNFITKYFLKKKVLNTASSIPKLLPKKSFFKQLLFTLKELSRTLLSLFTAIGGKLLKVFGLVVRWIGSQIIYQKIHKTVDLGFHKVTQLFISKFYKLFFSAKEGRLSVYFMIKLGIKNLLYSKSRTLVTTGAIALGSGAIVFLVSFAYGLEVIVTGRLIFPNATRIADVQTASTALVLDQAALEEITQVSGVEAVAPAINAAGTLEYNNSKTDVVIIAAQNEFLSYSNLLPIEGNLFSAVADQRYADVQERVDELKELIALTGEVLGETQQGEVFSWGELIGDKTFRFRVKDGIYLPVRSDPYLDSPILGYVRGSIVSTYPGQEVWGETYQSTDTVGKFKQDASGIWFGRWVKATVPLHQEQAPTVYVPLADEAGSQVTAQGYLPQLNLHILSQEEMVVEQYVEQVRQERKEENQVREQETQELREGLVLGESTMSAQLSQEDELLMNAEESTEVATTAGSLRTVSELEGEQDKTDLTELMESQLTQSQEEEQLKASLAMIDVAKEGGKEIIVSTGLLKIWDISPSQIIGKAVNLEYILSGGVVSGLAGKVKSNPVEYLVIGVIQDNRSIVISPLGDLESMGTDRFTTLKILGKNEIALKEARSHIEALGFSTQSLTDTLEQVNKLFTVMRFLLGLFGMIALVVAIFGMFNTLTISLLERTREIGVMKTLGTTDADVLKLFMVESFLIGCLGGILGVVLGTGLGNVVNILFNLFRSTPTVKLFVAPLGFLISVYFLSLAVGVITGLYPSNRAKKISALNALRYE